MVSSALTEQGTIVKKQDAAQRFLKYAAIGSTDECWPWRGARGGNGSYGAFTVREIGEIPGGLTIDHLCANTLCVNPWHMEVVTRRVNTLRALSRKYGDVIFSGGRICKCGREMRRKKNKGLPGNWYCGACAALAARAKSKNPKQWKLSRRNVIEIRERYKAGENGKVLAIAFGLADTMIYRVLRGWNPTRRYRFERE